MPMATIAMENREWLINLLAAQSREVKLDIISKLSASLTHKLKKDNAENFFDGLTNAWVDGTTAEDDIKYIHEARTSGLTRSLADF